MSDNRKKLAVIILEAVCAILALILVWNVIRAVAVILFVCLLTLAGRNLWEYLHPTDDPER